ncbi:ABC transporter permease subunit [Mycoplasma sp. 773]
MLAFLTSYFSNIKTNSKYIAIPSKVIVIALRIFPELFFVYLFKISFDKKLAIALIFCWFTWLWLHEYFSQIIENANFSIFYHLVKSQHSRQKAFWTEIWPQLRKKFISYFIYAFETNLRWSAILANIGFLGIGILINPQIQPINYTELIIPLLILVSFLFLVEIISENINKFLFESRKQDNINFKKYQTNNIIKKTFISLFILLTFALICVAIKDLAHEKFYETEATSFLNNMFKGSWKDIIFSFSEDGIFWIIIQFASLVFLTFILTYFISYFRMLLMSKSIVGKHLSIFYKYLNILIRAIPAVIIFLMLSNLFEELSASFVFAFGIHSASSISRNLYQTINNISIEKIKELKKLGFSNFLIYRNFIRPKIRLDFISFASLELEKIARNFIIYGSLSSSLLGQKTNLTRAKDIADVSPYLWIGFIIIALISFTSYFIRFSIKQRN